MRAKRIILATLCGALSVLVGCRTTPLSTTATAPTIRGVIVDPSLGAFNYAHPGDILSFTALDPSASAFYIIFDGPTPCANGATYLPVTGNTPGTCPVGPVSSYRYHISSTPPPPPPPGGTIMVKPRSCPQCQLIVVPSSSNPAPATPATPGVPKAANQHVNAAGGDGQPFLASVTCKSGTASVLPIQWPQNGDVVWVDGDNLGYDLTITVPAGTCGTQTVFKQREACTLTASPGTVTYSVTAESCANPGTTESLTITAP